MKTVVIGIIGLALLAVGCGNNEAEAVPPSAGVDVEDITPSPDLERDEQATAPYDDVVTPNEDGVIEPTDDRVIMPPDVMGKPEDTNINTPDPSDQLERNRVEHGEPL